MTLFLDKSAFCELFNCCLKYFCCTSLFIIKFYIDKNTTQNNAVRYICCFSWRIKYQTRKKARKLIRKQQLNVIGLHTITQGRGVQILLSWSCRSAVARLPKSRQIILSINCDSLMSPLCRWRHRLNKRFSVCFKVKVT